MEVFRVFPWVRSARVGEPGHPLHVPPTQGHGRIDNPEDYQALYASDAAPGAVAERLGRFHPWPRGLSDGIGSAALAIARVSIGAGPILNLDDARPLLDRALRPSDVATRDRADTQRWALEVFRERRWIGVRWWSYYEARWGSVGVWDHTQLTVIDVEPLTEDHPAFIEAGSMLGRI